MIGSRGLLHEKQGSVRSGRLERYLTHIRLGQAHLSMPVVVSPVMVPMSRMVTSVSVCMLFEASGIRNDLS